MPYKIHFVNPVDLGGYAPGGSVEITREQYQDIKLNGIQSVVAVSYSFKLSGGGTAEGEVLIPVSNIAAIVAQET